MRRLLVTGGAGFIGANFVLHWLHAQPHDRVVVLDALTYAGNRANLAAAEGDARYRFVHGDICSRAAVEALLRAEGIDTVVHFAAESHVDRSIRDPDAFIRTNVLGTQALLEAARTVWLKERALASHLFHHVSTDEVYGSLQPGDAPFTERTRYAPNSPYSASKAAADHLVRAYHHTYGLRTTTSNCSNNYGPLRYPEKLIPLTILKILAGEALPVYGDGSNVRDWLHVSDHCRGIELILARGRVGEVYNLGGECERRNIDLVRTLCAIVDTRFASSPALRARFARCPAARAEKSETLISFVTDRPGHDYRYAMDVAKARAELGYEPQLGAQRGFEQVVDWYLEHGARRDP
ncbi:MAG TPA: dTDP-glucose 4,6-dehydratase [Steroidobacteraceae bacterium]|nr:dTDP-glucose 4,6-dehydratase [Steroidobacteraceae bacterium]